MEKYLKALLTLSGIPAIATHDLGRLVADLPPEQRAHFTLGDIVALNPYAVEVRYADDWREPERGEAMRALKTAELVRLEARRLLPPEAVP